MLKKILGAVALGLGFLGTSASANVSYAEVGGFTGTFDLGPYYSAIAIIVTAIAIIAALKLAIRQFKSV